jgi:hypothetical protein
VASARERRGAGIPGSWTLRARGTDDVPMRRAAPRVRSWASTAVASAIAGPRSASPRVSIRVRP